MLIINGIMAKSSPFPSRNEQVQKRRIRLVICGEEEALVKITIRSLSYEIRRYVRVRLDRLLCALPEDDLDELEVEDLDTEEEDDDDELELEYLRSLDARGTNST